ncbi:MAG: BadF/BadG/BcrA/BcrD ATPase family protein [Paracoccaceae bacterium]
MSGEKILIGVDGGGTSCRAAMVTRGARFEAVGGAANVSTDFDGAIATIRAAARRLAAEAGLAERDLSRATAHLGLAGAMNAEIAGRVGAAMPFARTAVTDDRPTSIAGALGDADGTVAAIGTGSFVGRQRAGRLEGVGGWGFFIGDQAAGAWLLRRCLEETMLAVDGLRPATGLTARMLAEHGGDPGRIVLFAGSSAPADYARLARDVVAAAEAGDALGAALLDEGAAYIRAALSRLGWAAPEPLVLTGGLGPFYARWMGLATAEAKGTALDGALVLAGRAAR